MDIEHRPSKPSASQDLVSLYSLTPLSNAVARFDPITGKKNTMRKSYQGHIKDLPGKNVITPDSIIREILRVPESEADTFVGPRNIRRLERDVLEGFGVMPGVIPDVRTTYDGIDYSLMRVCWDWMMI
jgi:Rox3 mediator complex subunit